MTQANLSVTIITLTPDIAKQSLDEMFNDALRAVARRYDRWRLGFFEEGVVVDTRFTRVRWTGVWKPSSRPEYSGRAMRGFAYATIADGKFIFLMSQDPTAHATRSLPVAEAAVLTTRVERPYKAKNNE